MTDVDLGAYPLGGADLDHALPGRLYPLHVLHVLPMLRPGGMEQALLRVIRGLSGRRWRHTIVAFRQGPGLGELPYGQEVRCLNAEGRDLGAFLRLSRLIDNLKPDMVHARNWSTWPDALAACRVGRWRPPLIFSFHGFTSTDAAGLKRRAVSQLLSRQTQTIFTVSAAARDLMIQRLRIPASRIGLIPNGVDLERFQPKDRPGQRGQPFVVGTLGSLSQVKNQALLVKACALLVRQGMDLKLSIAGDGPERPALESLAEQVGIADRLHLAGRVTNPDEFLQTLDLFVLPSRTEAHPNCLLEAMASGLPCIGTRVGGIPWVLGDGRAGLLVADDSPGELAAAIEKMHQDPGARQQFARLGREEVQNRFSLTQMIADYALLYQQVRAGELQAACSTRKEAAERKQRVLMLGPTFPPTGGMATVTNLLAQSRLAEQFDLCVLHNAKTTAEGRSLATGIRAQLSLLWRIASRLRQPGSHLTHIHTCSGFSFFRDCGHAAIASGLGSRVVWHVHGARFDEFLASLGRPAKRIARHALETAAAVIVLGQQWIRKLRVYAPRARWVAIENGVAVPDAPAEVADQRAMLLLGNLGQRKGAADLVEAMILAQAQCPEVFARLAGNEIRQGEKQTLQQRLKQAGAQGAVEFLGVVQGPAKDQAIAEAGFFCLPSYAEGLPMAMLEAMAAGLPVIVTRVGAIPEVIVDGVEGFLIDPGDVDTLADRIIKLTRDADLRRQMGQAARSKVIAAYSLDKMAEKISRVYRQALGAL